MSERRVNRLSTETSPYLLQHARNPVDWYPWGEEAFREARTQDKPLLLSVGYSSCHWCHVMERESFENEEIARVMNEQFVNIKVDREERPDVDALYMDYVQLTTGHGGWPLTVFLTPDRTPFYGGTYFPPVDRYGRPGFKTVLSRVASYYRSRKSEISASRSDISRWMREGQVLKFEPGPVDPNVLDRASDVLLRSFDPSYGGFGGAPKFPSSMAIRFLLRFGRRRGSSAAREAVSVSLHRMAAGGIYDQLGGGFHRYSVDDRWLVPHFEKMLYDNALLVRLYLEAFQATGESSFREVAEQTLAYVQRDLTDPSGGFYSAEDADSEGEEGRFYVWQHAEVRSVLDSEAAELFCDFYGVSALGNWEGTNILNRRRSLQGLAREKGLDIDAAGERLDHARRRLLDVRLRRPRPGLDNKIIASWNGLMLAAFAEAGFVLNTGPFLETARRNAAFLLDELCRSGRLLRIWTQGTAKVQGFLEDYAHVVEGLLALYEASGETRWLEGAVSLTETQLQLFSNPESDLFYSTSTEHEQLMIRRTDFQDNAVPSGNSTTAGNLLRLAILTGETAYRERAERMLGRMVEPASRYPLAFGNWLTVLDFYLGPVSEVVCIGDPGKREDLLEPLRRLFLPNKVIVLSERPEAAAQLVPLLAGKPAAGDPVVYLCRGYTCGQPVTVAADLLSLLEAEN